MAWSGLLSESGDELRSKLADQKNNNNITGFKNARVDELANQYDRMFNVADRIRAIREIDGSANEYHYALLWYGPFTSIIYWNKFGTPPGYFSRTGDYLGAFSVREFHSSGGLTLPNTTPRAGAARFIINSKWSRRRSLLVGCIEKGGRELMRDPRFPYSLLLC